MGSDTNIACKTCKKSYYCGYGSGANRDWRVAKFLKQEHSGHDITEDFSTDYLELRADGHLWSAFEGISYVPMDIKDEIFIENYRDYEHVDLTHAQME